MTPQSEFVIRRTKNMTNNLKSTTLNISNFGLNLYRIRTEQGKTRQWLADELELADQRIIYDYENGVKFPRLENALKIAMALGVDLDSMIR